MKKRRDPCEVIERILAVVPDDQVAFRERLRQLDQTFRYQPPEMYPAVWSRGTDIITAGLGEPPLVGWKEEVRQIWMGEK